MLLSESVSLAPDQAVFVQLGIFLLVFAVLHFFVFRPVLRILRLRREQTEGEREKVKALVAKTDTMILEYEEKMGAARMEAIQLKDSIRREGEEQGNRLIQG